MEEGWIKVEGAVKTKGRGMKVYEDGARTRERMEERWKVERGRRIGGRQLMRIERKVDGGFVIRGENKIKRDISRWSEYEGSVKALIRMGYGGRVRANEG